MGRDPLDFIPDARDGLTRAERVILWQLYELEKELGVRERPDGDDTPPMERGGPRNFALAKRSHVPTAMLYGRVVEYVDMSVQEFQHILQRLVGRG